MMRASSIRALVLGAIVVGGAVTAMVPSARANCDDTGACWLIPPELQPTLGCRATIMTLDVRASLRCVAGVDVGDPGALLVAAQGDKAVPQFKAGSHGYINITVERTGTSARASTDWNVFFSPETAVNWTSPRLVGGTVTSQKPIQYGVVSFKVLDSQPPGQADLDFALWDETGALKRGALALSVVEFPYYLIFLLLLVLIIIGASLWIDRKVP